MQKYPILAKMLKEEHEVAGMSIRELARACGFSPASYYNYVAGDTTPDLDTLEGIARYFKTTISVLTGRPDDEKGGDVKTPGFETLSEEKKLYWKAILEMTDDEALFELAALRKRNQEKQQPK